MQNNQPIVTMAVTQSRQPTKQDINRWIHNACLKYEVDEKLVRAIIKAESTYRTEAVSNKGAVGLMQLMPQTANYIIRKSGYSNCSKITPDCNIKLGTWYLSNLYQKFGNLIYATAAYNAGPNRSKRWYNQLNNLDNRIQIELIPIPITRDYVQKVIAPKIGIDLNIANFSSIMLEQKDVLNGIVK